MIEHKKVCAIKLAQTFFDSALENSL